MVVLEVVVFTVGAVADARLGELASRLSDDELAAVDEDEEEDDEDEEDDDEEEEELGDRMGEDDDWGGTIGGS